MSYRTLANFMLAVPGAVMAASVEGYSGAEREVGRAGDKAHTRVCFIDYDRNNEQAVWITEHLRNNYPDVHVFAVSANTEPERIIAAMRVGCNWYLLKPIQLDRVLDAAHAHGRNDPFGFGVCRNSKHMHVRIVVPQMLRDPYCLLILFRS